MESIQMRDGTIGVIAMALTNSTLRKPRSVASAKSRDGGV